MAEQPLREQRQAGLDAAHRRPRVAVELGAEPGHALAEEPRLRRRRQAERGLHGQAQVGRQLGHRGRDPLHEPFPVRTRRLGRVEAAHPGEQRADALHDVRCVNAVAAAELLELPGQLHALVRPHGFFRHGHLDASTLVTAPLTDPQHPRHSHATGDH